MIFDIVTLHNVAKSIEQLVEKEAKLNLIEKSYKLLSVSYSPGFAVLRFEQTGTTSEFIAEIFITALVAGRLIEIENL